jgi:hypothetical protein
MCGGVGSRALLLEGNGHVRPGVSFLGRIAFLDARREEVEMHLERFGGQPCRQVVSEHFRPSAPRVGNLTRERRTRCGEVVLERPDRVKEEM